MTGKQANNLYILLFCVVCEYCSYISCENDFTVKTCDDIGTFQQLFGITLDICAEECYGRQRCDMFMFRFGMNYCALKEVFSLQSLGEEGPVCGYYSRGDWSQIDLGPCNGHTCSETERCTSITDDKFECVKSECPPPNEIADATVMSNTHTIGATNRYTCGNGFFGHGAPTITCGDDAIWTVTEFQCINKQSCPIPALRYVNADLTHIEGNLYTPGTILTITCREGYRKMAEDWKITCETGLLWKPKSISCCPDETILVGRTCVAIIDAGVVTSYDDAVTYCEDMDGSLTWTNFEGYDAFNKTITDFVLQDITISQIETDWNYLQCAAEHGVEGDPTKTLKEQINEVKKNAWNDKSCWRGNMWYGGQPDFTGENCVARDIQVNTNRNYHDVACNFDSTLRVGFACRIAEIII